MHGHLAIFVEMLWYYTATTTTYLHDVMLHHQYNDNEMRSYSIMCTLTYVYWQTSAAFVC